MKRTLVMLAPCLLVGCQTIGPTWSELTGVRYHPAVMDRQAVIVSKVDGESTPLRGPIKIAPGRHEIVVESLRHGSFAGGYQERLTLDIEPCKRYYINAQYEDRIRPRYAPVVDEVELIAGCRPGLG